MFFLMSVSAIFIFACNRSNTNKSGMGDLVEIDVSKKYPEKELYIQDIAEVEYIPLETNSNTLMRSWARIVHVSDNYIVASNTSDGDVFIFDGKGKSKFSFNHRGRGGMEYNWVRSIAFDEQAKEIFISDGTKILVYAEDGKFKRTLECPPNFSPEIYIFDDATLLAYDDFGLLTNRYSNKPYLFMSKKDGNIIDTLDFHLSERVSNRLIMEVEVDGQTRPQPFTLALTNNRSYGENFLIADWSSDTIYRLTPKKEMEPVIIRTPPVQNSNPKILLSNELITDRFIFVLVGVMEIDKQRNSFPLSGLMYDFETGQWCDYKLINNDCHSLRIGFVPAITPENIGICLLDTARLFELDETGKLNGDLKQILKSLDEEDNPVLMKIKFNQ